MATKNKFIPNPNKISKIEHDFITNEKGTELEKKETYTGRIISMPDSFYKKLNDFLKKNPTEGNRSSFMVRIVAEYIDKKGEV